MQAVSGGANMIQLREKDLSAHALYELGIVVKDVVGSSAMLIINDRLDVALALGADGVQLPESGLPIKAARRLVGPGVLVGRSVHTVKAGIEASSAGADFLIAGTIFQSASHPEGPARGTGFLRKLKERVSVPILAIGGVTDENVGKAMREGASGAAVITAISEAEDPIEAARSLVDEMTRSSAI